MTIVLNILGIVAILGILYLMSPNKNEINKKMILKAFIIQRSHSNEDCCNLYWVRVVGDAK